MKKLALLKDRNGFTLAELLVVVGLIAILGTLLTTIFIRSLRGSNRAELVLFIKQNGQAILEKLDKSIRNSDFVVCTSTDNKIIVTVKKGVYTRYKFFDPLGTTENGKIQQDIVQRQGGEINNPASFFNRVCNINDTIYTSPVILTDTDTEEGVSVENGSFTKTLKSGFRDIVTISFKLRPGVSAPQVISSQIDAVEFSTTIELR